MAVSHRMASGKPGRKASVLGATWPLTMGRWLGHPCWAARMNQRLSQM